MFRNLSNSLKTIRASGPVATGGTDVTLAPIKLAGFTSLLIITTLGALAVGAAPALKIKGGKNPDGSDAVDLFDNIEGTPAVKTATAADGSKTMWIDAGRAGQHVDYIVPVITRGGGNAAIENVTALLYGASIEPVPQDVTSAGGIIVLEPRPA